MPKKSAQNPLQDMPSTPKQAQMMSVRRNVTWFFRDLKKGLLSGQLNKDLVDGWQVQYCPELEIELAHSNKRLLVENRCVQVFGR